MKTVLDMNVTSWRTLLSFWLLALAVLPAAGQSTVDSTGTTFDVRGLPLSEALVRLAQAHSLKLAYAPELVAGRTSTCATEVTAVDALLRCVLAGSGLAAERMPNGVYVIGPAPTTAEATREAPSETRRVGSITGTVRGAPSGEILVGAHVRVMGTALGAVSRDDGTFLIARVPSGPHSLEVSMLGFAPAHYDDVHVLAGEAVAVNVAMAPQPIALDEVVVSSTEIDGEATRRRAVDVDLGGVHVGPVSVGFLIGSSAGARLQLNGLAGIARDTLEGVQLAGLFNVTTGPARGAQLSGFVNAANGDLEGVQLAGLMNVTRSNVRGGQGAGLLNFSGDIEGIQGAGLWNVAYGGLDGLQVAGIFNSAGRASRGIQGAGLFNVAGGGLWGIQGAGILNIAAGDVEGTQFAGLFNAAVRDVSGAQVAGLINAAGSGPSFQAAGLLNVAGSTAPGVQVAGLANVSAGPVQLQVGSILNVAGRVRYLQAGLVNFATSNDGVPLGLLSYVHDAGLKLDLLVDETGFVTTMVRSGNRRFANYLGYSTLAGSSALLHGPVVGLGTELRLGPRTYGTIDAFDQGLTDRHWHDWQELIRLRATVGYVIAPRLAVFAGTTLNLLLSGRREDAIDLPWQAAAGRWGRYYYRAWPGLVLGVRVTTRRFGREY